MSTIVGLKKAKAIIAKAQKELLANASPPQQREIAAWVATEFLSRLNEAIGEERRATVLVTLPEAGETRHEHP